MWTFGDILFKLKPNKPEKIDETDETGKKSQESSGSTTNKQQTASTEF